VQIRKSEDFRINEIATIIEELQDYKHNIQPFDLAKTIVKYIDNIYGQGYAKKISDQNKDNKAFIKDRV